MNTCDLEVKVNPLQIYNSENP